MNKVLTGLTIYVGWSALAAWWAIVFFQVQVLLIALAIFIGQTPALTPPGWHSGQVSGVYRCSTVILGAGWLGLVLFMLHWLQEKAPEGQLWRSGAKLALIGLGVYGLSAVVMYLLPY